MKAGGTNNRSDVTPARRSGKDLGYQKNQNLKQRGPVPKDFQVTRVKTDGRIGSATPHSELKGGFTVDNNRKVQPHHGTLGSVAASHMSHTYESTGAYQPRAAKAKQMAKPNPKKYANPVNVERGTLKHVKPD